MRRGRKLGPPATTPPLLVPKLCCWASVKKLQSKGPRAERSSSSGLLRLPSTHQPDLSAIMECAKADRDMLPLKLDSSMGSKSWNWPAGPPSKQKLASFELFSPEREFFKRGAHMP